jgi:hypothetical protein
MAGLVNFGKRPMLDLNTPNGTIALFALGVMVGLLGLLGLLKGRGKTAPSWKGPLVMAAVFALTGAGSALAGLSQPVWWPLTVLALVLVVLALLRSPWLAVVLRSIVTLVGKPRFQAAVLFLAGGALLIAQAYQLDNQLTRSLENTDQHLLSLISAPTLDPVVGRSAFTDTGRQVPLWVPRPSDLDGDLAADEAAFLRNLSLDQHLIRTSALQASYNCHGWIFTGGRFWVKGSTVEEILRDNEYEVVSRPAPGDLIVYRNEGGEVMHTALVRAVREDGTLLLESKWGRLGCFVHTDSKHAYGHYSRTYYHTRRGGHLLRGQYVEGGEGRI